jgi:hypothetical protein
MPPPLPTPDRGFLDAPSQGILIEFQYNPDNITDWRSVTYATLNAPGRIVPVRQYTQGGDRELSFKINVDSTFRGPVAIAVGVEGSITPELNKYRALMYPETPDWHTARYSFLRLFNQMQQFVPPPLCRFGRGSGEIIDCVVTRIIIKETRFNRLMEPVRAEVTVSLFEISPFELE